MCASPRSYLTPEEYLALERQAQTKSEYLRGEVYALAGASFAHTMIVSNTLVLLAPQLKRRSCTAHSSDLRVKVPATGLYAYPDIVVVCGRPQFEDRHRDTLLNPTVIFEILSPSTEGYDRGEKFADYRMLESLSDYILVSQHRPLVEHFARQPDESWLLRSCEGVEAILPVPSIGCELPLADIYDKVEWPEEETGSKLIGVRLVRDEPGHYEYEYEFEGGSMPTALTRPASIAEVQAAVRAAPPGARILARGRGTKRPLSTPPDGAVVLDISGLSGIIEYEPGEFTFTALAGTPIAEIAAALAGHGQFLPFDPPLADAGATLGGTVAAGLSGPGRYRYGGVRDFILGIRYVDGAGEVVRTGGKVVKNAAGFDISKLMAGSLGSLGVLVELTFKVFPKPEAYATLRVPHPTLDAALATLHRLTGSQMDLLRARPGARARWRGPVGAAGRIGCRAARSPGTAARAGGQRRGADGRRRCHPLAHGAGLAVAARGLGTGESAGDTSAHREVGGGADGACHENHRGERGGRRENRILCDLCVLCGEILVPQALQRGRPGGLARMASRGVGRPGRSLEGAGSGRPGRAGAAGADATGCASRGVVRAAGEGRARS